MYNIDVKDTKDRFLQIAEMAVKSVTEAAVPGAFLVDILPVCVCLESLIYYSTHPFL